TRRRCVLMIWFTSLRHQNTLTSAVTIALDVAWLILVGGTQLARDRLPRPTKPPASPTEARSSAAFFMQDRSQLRERSFPPKSHGPARAIRELDLRPGRESGKCHRP